VLSKITSVLFATFVFSCGLTHATAFAALMLNEQPAVGLLEDANAFFNGMTALVSTVTAIHLLRHTHVIADLISRVDVMPRGHAANLAQQCATMSETVDRKDAERAAVAVQRAVQQKKVAVQHKEECAGLAHVLLHQQGVSMCSLERLAASAASSAVSHKNDILQAMSAGAVKTANEVRQVRVQVRSDVERAHTETRVELRHAVEVRELGDRWAELRSAPSSSTPKTP
jgi:hypothetical protein